MAPICAYSCRHPLWGGNGFCVADGVDFTGTIRETCSCDDGFSPRDSFGHPSCVRPVVLMYCYATIAAAGAAITALFVWHLEQHRRLPEATRTTRKSGIRLRFMVSASVMAICHAVLFSIAAVVPLTKSRVFQAFYTVCIPMALVVSLAYMELWVESLPSQLLPSGSFAIRFKAFADKHALFMRLKITGFICLALIGSMTFFFDHLGIARLINLMASAVSAALCFGFCFVAVHLTLMINRAMAKGRQSGRPVYVKARRKVWAQTMALGSVSFVFMTSLSVLELTRAGRRTPIIPFSVMILEQFIAGAMAVHFLAPKEIRALACATSCGNPHHVLSRCKKLVAGDAKRSENEGKASTSKARVSKLRTIHAPQLNPTSSTVVPTVDDNYC